MKHLLYAILICLPSRARTPHECYGLFVQFPKRNTHFHPKSSACTAVIYNYLVGQSVWRIHRLLNAQWMSNSQCRNDCLSTIFLSSLPPPPLRHSPSILRAQMKSRQWPGHSMYGTYATYIWTCNMYCANENSAQYTQSVYTNEFAQRVILIDRTIGAYVRDVCVCIRDER